MSDIHVRAAAYEVSLWPEGEESVNTSAFTIRVEARGRGGWAVLHHGYCLGMDGEWDYEPLPSSREDDWLAGHRFDMERALELAIEHAPKVRVNGMTAAECRGWEAGR